MRWLCSPPAKAEGPCIRVQSLVFWVKKALRNKFFRWILFVRLERNLPGRRSMGQRDDTTIQPRGHVLTKCSV